MNTQAEQFFDNAKKWKEEFDLLRTIVRENEALEEDYKWMHPCYTYGKKNVVLIHGFKEYCALLFHKGALLKDTKGVLIQQTENVQSARQMRFTDVGQVMKLASVITDYINEAIEIEKSGKKVAMKKVAEYTIHEEFKEYYALIFHKGALLKDKKGVLIQQTENVQSARQMRFNDVGQVMKLASVITDYINEAIEIEKSGKKVAMKKVADYPIPEEFQA